jgi:hypothetical protein
MRSRTATGTIKAKDKDKEKEKKIEKDGDEKMEGDNNGKVSFANHPLPLNPTRNPKTIIGERIKSSKDLPALVLSVETKNENKDSPTEFKKSPREAEKEAEKEKKKDEETPQEEPKKEERTRSRRSEGSLTLKRSLSLKNDIRSLLKTPRSKQKETSTTETPEQQESSESLFGKSLRMTTNAFAKIPMGLWKNSDSSQNPTPPHGTTSTTDQGPVLTFSSFRENISDTNVKDPLTSGHLFADDSSEIIREIRTLPVDENIPSEIRKRNMVINEIVTTELDYVLDLITIAKVFIFSLIFI